MTVGRGRRVLIVKDEASIRALLRVHLARAEFDVTENGDGRRALDVGRGERFDLIVLDVMLPGLDGVTLCRALRVEGANTATPILMLTARDTEPDKVLGLESGADDYLTKPFGVRELLARIGALLRRTPRAGDAPWPSPAASTASTSSLGSTGSTGSTQSTMSTDPTQRTGRPLIARNLRLDPARRQVTVRGAPVELTKQEFEVLSVLMARPGMVFSRPALLDKVWRGDTYVTERTVDAVVSRLRKKIEQDAQDPR